MHAVLEKEMKSKGTKSSKKPGLQWEPERENDRQISRPSKDQVCTIEGALFLEIQS